jgi:hypothetical protein
MLVLAGQCEKDRGHAPDQRAMASMRQVANAMTRRAKHPGALDFTALVRGWERASRAAKLGRPHDLARTRSHAAPLAGAATGARSDTRAELAEASARPAPRGELTHAQEHAAIAVHCAVRRGPRATTTDAATGRRGRRRDARSG